MAASTTSVPELWRQGVNLALPQKSKVIVPGAYVNFDAQVSGAGDTVHFNEVSNLTVSSYNGSDALSYSALAVEDTSLVLDQYSKVTFKVDDIVGKQSDLTLVTSGVQKAADALAPYYDSVALTALKTAGAVADGSPFEAADISTAAKIVTLLSSAYATMLSNGEGEGGVRALISPQAWATLVAGNVFGSGSEFNAQTVENGTIGNIAGLEIAVVPALTEAEEEMVVYKKDNLVFAQQLYSPETIRLESYFSTAFRALSIYGVKVLRSTGVIAITETNVAP